MRPRTSAAVSFCWVPSLMRRAIYVRPVGIFPAPTGSGDEHADSIIGGEFVSESENEYAHHSRRISRTTSPSGSWIATTSGICPGRLWVAQPKHGS